MGLFRATRYVASLPLVSVEGLVRDGVRLVLLDRDNTCVPRDARVAPDAVTAWLDRAREAGLELCLVSNNFHTSHVSRTARELGVSTARVSQLIKAGLLDSWRDGTKRMVSRSSVEARKEYGPRPGRPARDHALA